MWMKLLMTLAVTGCYWHSYPVTPDVAEAGTYRIETSDGAGGGSIGTAWAVNDTYAVTAGHMCDDVSYALVSNTGRFISATPVVWEYHGADGLDYNADLCVLRANVPLHGALIIADAMPTPGTKVGYVGWPDGVFARNTGVYVGDTDGPDDHKNDYVSTTPCDHGSSGSAMFYDRGVFGVVIRMRTDGGRKHDGSDGCTAVPLKELRDTLDYGDISYVTTPDPLGCEGDYAGCDPVDGQD